MMSIETIIIKHIKSDICYKDNCVHKSMLNINSDIMNMNSQKLECIVEKILAKFKDISIDRKLTFNPSLLAGITIDWRHLDDWNLIRKEVEPYILKIVNNEINNNNNNNNNNNSEYSLYIQRYSTHPFIDIYSTLCSKEIAYDNIYDIVNKLHINRLENKNIIYFGDSENDNPAFRKADISIGIKSDERLNPKLDCQYVINFNQLPKFLLNLLKIDFIFAENLL
jgi:hydroxymethylpyrimidine pyrophosphatase-like HAD family hydrolase